MDNIKDIEGYEGLYTVNENGDIFSIRKNRFISQTISHGYVRVFLCNGTKKNLSVHRIVCNAYNKREIGKNFVNHKDGNKKNNHFSNLEWCTHAENLRHSVDILLRKHGKRKRIIQYSLSGEKLSEFESMRCACKVLGLSVSGISRCLKLGTNRYANYLWKYEPQ